MQLGSLQHSQYQRAQEMLSSYWQKLRGERALPLEAEVESSALAPIWETCFLVNVKPYGKLGDYRYSYLGSALAKAYGVELEYEAVSQHIIAPDTKEIRQLVDAVVRTKEVQYSQGEFINPHKMHVRYRACAMPLADKIGENEVTYVLGTMHWKSY